MTQTSVAREIGVLVKVRFGNPDNPSWPTSEHSNVLCKILRVVKQDRFGYRYLVERLDNSESRKYVREFGYAIENQRYPEHGELISSGMLAYNCGDPDAESSAVRMFTGEML